MREGEETVPKEILIHVTQDERRVAILSGGKLDDFYIELERQMNYQIIYDNLINQAKNRLVDGYTEKHHILPKSMGGSNQAFNIVKLTAREHFLAHWLLFKIYKTPSMAKAFRLMLDVSKKPHSKTYEIAKTIYAKSLSVFNLGDKSEKLPN